MAKGDTRCVEGRIMRHDPQHDDPELETDRGQCEECEGKGCEERCDCCDSLVPREQISRCWLNGIETFACDECRSPP